MNEKKEMKQKKWSTERKNERRSEGKKRKGNEAEEKKDVKINEVNEKIKEGRKEMRR